MPRHHNVTPDELAAFCGAGKTIQHVAPAFAASSQQASFDTRRNVQRQRQHERREQRATRERERLSELYGAADPFTAMLAMQCGSN